MTIRRLILLAAATALAGASAEEPVYPDRDPAWAEAWRRPPMTADETRAFMRRLSQYVVDHHMKKAEASPQRGMVYEYFHVARARQPDAFIQGEGLDTMHDGAWLAAAMASAYRATGDAFYKDVLVKWQLPFYLRMLNRSDELFDAEPNHGRPGDDRGWRSSKEWLLQGREKGFVPYWWDDGGSVSLDMLGRKDGDQHVNFAGHNDYAGRPNPQRLLSGYSHGSSNHLAQDLAVMLQQSWLLLRASGAPGDEELARQVADAAENLRACRARHGSPAIPAVLAACAVARSDEAARRALTEETWASLRTARNDYRRARFEFQAGQPVSLPAFADDQEYRYYVGLAKNGAPTPPVAFRLVYDAYTLPLLYRAYSDDAEVPPGINVFDLHPYRFLDGKPADTRSQRKGPGGRPRPVGSRFGPQNMVVSGWALQALRANPGLWDEARRQIAATNYFPDATEEQVRAALERELAGGLRTWEAIFDAKGYIPTALGAGDCGAGFSWDELSDCGGYAHLVSAAAQWLLYLEGRSDWRAAGEAGSPAKSASRFISGFESFQMQAGGTTISGAKGGSGPPVLLLHGFPQSHIEWRGVAPLLARDFTVVATDLRGYGGSGRPPEGDNHAGYSKRAMADDQVDVMRQLGFARFAVVGHDRGGRVGHRMALDHPGAVTKLAVLDIAPTRYLYEHADRAFATAYYHWFFLIQPAPCPETLLAGNEEFFLRTQAFGGLVPGAVSDEVFAEYLRVMREPAALHAMCEDYRAAASIDLEHDEADLSRRLSCPVLALWGAQSVMGRQVDVLASWRERAEHVEGKVLPCGHFLVEQAPEKVADVLRRFLRSS